MANSILFKFTIFAFYSAINLSLLLQFWACGQSGGQALRTEAKVRPASCVRRSSTKISEAARESEISFKLANSVTALNAEHSLVTVRELVFAKIFLIRKLLDFYPGYQSPGETLLSLNGACQLSVAVGERAGKSAWPPGEQNRRHRYSLCRESLEV